MASNLKLKSVVVNSDSDNSDHEEEKVTEKFELDLPLEKLNLGPKKKLLVLNLGGLLVDRVNKRNEFTVRGYTPDLVHGNFRVFKRPYVDQFMKFCLERFEVGLWSSAMDHNLDPILDTIMVGLRRKLVFVWDQENCIHSEFSTLENKYKPIFLKKLKKLWGNNFRGGRFSEFNTLLIDDEPHVALLNPPNTGVFPLAYKVKNFRGGRFSEFNTLLIDDEPHVALLNPPNTGVFPLAYKVKNFRGGRFSEFNTLLIDDEPHVALLNPPNTGVFPLAYKVKNGRDTFLGPNGKMQEFLEGLVDANDVPSYVKAHPLGQPAITDSHPRWDYYAKVVRAAKVHEFSS